MQKADEVFFKTLKNDQPLLLGILSLTFLRPGNWFCYGWLTNFATDLPMIKCILSLETTHLEEGLDAHHC
jgi:hypothetical protein